MAHTIQSWQASPRVIAWWERDKPERRFREERVPAYVLPDPLRCPDSTRIAAVEQWEKKGRSETLELFREHVFGRSPGLPGVPQGVRFEVIAEDAAALDGAATHRTVRIQIPVANGGIFSFDGAVFVPNARRGPAAAFLLINNRLPKFADPTRRDKSEFWPAEEIVARGYATAVFHTRTVQPHEKDGLSRGIVAAMNGGGGRKAHDWATIAAWAWGASRVMDYLQTIQGEIDPRRIAVIGHSRGGKTALWAGAQDKRFGLVIANNSGRGGAALTRRRLGETVRGMNEDFPHWFCENYKRYNDREGELPVDQHQLLALIAPRAVCVGSADEDLWADPRGEWLSLVHAGPVYGLYGEEAGREGEMPGLEGSWRGTKGLRGYHVLSGGHGLTVADWERYMGFAEGVWGGWKEG